MCARKGFSGKYRMLVHRVWGKVTAGKVTVDIQTRNADRPHIHQQIPLGEKDAVVLFDVQSGRRTEHLGGSADCSSRRRQRCRRTVRPCRGN